MTIALNPYPLLERTRWWMLAIGLVAVFARLWDLFSRTQYRGVVLIAAVVTLVVLLAIAGLTRRCLLDGSSRSITITTELFGLVILKKTLSTLQSKWVRARLAGGYRTAIIVEIGTHGYRTTQLIKMSSKSGKNIPSADEVCSQVALHLGLENKGYKGLA